MAGAILAIGAALSAATKNQIIAFVLTAALVFVLIAAGTQAVIGVFQGWAPDGLVRAIMGASLFGHFTAITRGVLDLRDLFYFLSIIVAFLGANAVLVDLLKAD
jgi:ABC-2 type transport system permease protein